MAGSSHGAPFKMKGAPYKKVTDKDAELQPSDTESGNLYTKGWRAGMSKDLTDEQIKKKIASVESKYPRKEKLKREMEDAIFEEKLRKSTNPKVRERYGIVKDTVKVKG